MSSPKMQQFAWPKWAMPTPFQSRKSMRKKKLKKAKKITAYVSDSIFREFGIVIPIASHKYPSVDWLHASLSEINLFYTFKDFFINFSKLLMFLQ